MKASEDVYFKDPVFIAKASIEVPEQSDILRVLFATVFQFF